MMAAATDALVHGPQPSAGLADGLAGSRFSSRKPLELLSSLALLTLSACSAAGDPGGSGPGELSGSGGGFDPAPRGGSGGFGASADGPQSTGGGSGTTGTGGATATGGSSGSSGSAGSGGSFGSSGSSGSGGSAAVTFDWPETVPGTGQCKAGHYQGDFIGIYAPAVAVFPAPIPVVGNVDLTLAESADGEFFDISGGKVSGLANGFVPYSADVVGKLDCKARKLVGASLKNGKYIVGIFEYLFEGPLQADYDTLTYAFVNGTWDVKEPNPVYGGSGTWNARSVP
jgi:hypothetical protein